MKIKSFEIVHGSHRIQVVALTECGRLFNRDVVCGHEADYQEAWLELTADFPTE